MRRTRSTSLKGRQLQVCVSLPPEYVRRLKALSRATHEPMAHYFREALRDLFAKHRPPPGGRLKLGGLGQRRRRGA